MGIKRMKYFEGEFLNVKDFDDEQQYHIYMLKKHNENLHSWGIASGLEIAAKVGERNVTIKKGMAIDAQGQQIILDKDREKELPDNTTATELYLTISYDKKETDPRDDITGVDSRETRIEEEPSIEFLKKSDFEKIDSSTPLKIFLAKVILDYNKTIASIDPHGRRYAGIRVEDYEIRFDPAKGHKHTGNPGEGPLISHNSLDNVLAANPTSNDPTEDKHVSDARAKSWQAHIDNRGNPHGTTAAQLTDYLTNLYIVPPTVLQFTHSDSNGATRRSRVGFSPKLAMISGGFEVTLGKEIEGRKKETYGSSLSGFWASGQAGSSGQSACSSQHIKKEPHTNTLIYSSAEMGRIFHIYIYYYDTSAHMTRPKAETLSGSISFSTPEFITVTLNREVTRDCDPIDDFSISICILCIS